MKYEHNLILKYIIQTMRNKSETEGFCKPVVIPIGQRISCKALPQGAYIANSLLHPLGQMEYVWRIQGSCRLETGLINPLHTMDGPGLHIESRMYGMVLDGK